MAGRNSGPYFAPSIFRRGKVLWSTERFGAGSVTLAGNRLLIIRETGELILAAASPKAFQPIATGADSSGDCARVSGARGRRAVCSQRRHARCFGSSMTVLGSRFRVLGSTAHVSGPFGAEPAGVAESRGRSSSSKAVSRSLAATFDVLAKLIPDEAPQLWQRGIALYYAGRFADCRRQFESHRTVNPDDVENAAWHFLCVARERDAGTGTAALLPVGPDARVPMTRGLSDVPRRADCARMC